MTDIGIYAIKNIHTGGVYIGSTASYGFERRWARHRERARRGKHHSRYFQNAWNQYGEAAFIFEPLLVCEPEQCKSLEQQLIDRLLPCYNMAKSVTSPMLGRRPSAETIQRMRHADNPGQFGKGEAHPNWGKSSATFGRQIHSQAYKDDLRQRMLGNQFAAGHPSWNSGKAHAAIRGSKNHNAKLTEHDVVVVKKLLGRRIKGRKIARQFGVSEYVISDIKRGKSWSWLDGAKD